MFVLFVVLTPFFGNNYFLMLHVMSIPFMMLHWVANDNNCALTLMEKKIREKIYGKVNKNDCFTCKIIEPIYDFKNNYKERATFIYSVTTLLWLISLYKLNKKYRDGKIKNFYDLMKI